MAELFRDIRGNALWDLLKWIATHWKLVVPTLSAIATVAVQWIRHADGRALAIVGGLVFLLVLVICVAIQAAVNRYYPPSVKSQPTNKVQPVLAAQRETKGLFSRRVHRVENGVVVLPFTFEAKGTQIETARVLAQASFYDVNGRSVLFIPYCLWTENEAAPEWRVLFSRSDTKEIKLLQWAPTGTLLAFGVDASTRHRSQWFHLAHEPLDVELRITDGHIIDDVFWYSVEPMPYGIGITPKKEGRSVLADSNETHADHNDLEAAVPPEKRRLTADQKRILENFLTQYKDHSIRLTYVSNEGALFSLELAAVFMAAQWRSMARFPHQEPLLANINGLLVQGSNEVLTKAIAGILRSVGLTAKAGGQNLTLPLNWISILIPHIF